MLFKHDIESWEDWCLVFCDTNAFSLLVYEITNCRNIYTMKKASNASFRFENKVIKIFPPIESGYDSSLDYKQELLGIKYANILEVPSYKFIKSGEIKDKYLFRYIIYEYVDGIMAVDYLNHLTNISFVKDIKNILKKLNLKLDEYPIRIDPIAKSLNNFRWDNVSHLKEEILSLVKNVKCNDFVFCHNDLTGDNIIVNDKVNVIDFADACISPRICEYPTIIFDLFEFNKEMIKEFKIGIDDFNNKIFDSLLLHEYGYLFITWISERIMGKNIEECQSVIEIKNALFQFLDNL